MPRFYALIKERNTLTEQESHVALLTRLDFGTKEIAIILGTQPSRVSTVKEQLNKKLFGQMGSRGLLYNMKQSEKI